jgi:hypothetical protein
MSKQNEKGAEVRRNQATNVNDPLLHIKRLEEEMDGQPMGKGARFHMERLHELLLQRQRPEEDVALANIVARFEDPDTDYTAHLETMVDAMLEVQRLQTFAIENGMEDNATGAATTRSTQEAFFMMSLLLRCCKPLTTNH